MILFHISLTNCYVFLYSLTLNVFLNVFCIIKRTNASPLFFCLFIILIACINISGYLVDEKLVEICVSIYCIKQKEKTITKWSSSTQLNLYLVCTSHILILFFVDVMFRFCLFGFTLSHYHYYYYSIFQLLDFIFIL